MRLLRRHAGSTRRAAVCAWARHRRGRRACDDPDSEQGSSCPRHFVGPGHPPCAWSALAVPGQAATAGYPRGQTGQDIRRPRTRHVAQPAQIRGARQGVGRWLPAGSNRCQGAGLVEPTLTPDVPWRPVSWRLGAAEAIGGGGHPTRRRLPWFRVGLSPNAGRRGAASRPPSPSRLAGIPGEGAVPPGRRPAQTQRPPHPRLVRLDVQLVVGLGEFAVGHC